MKKNISVLLLVTIILALGACGKKTDISNDAKNVFVINADYPAYDSAQHIIDSADLIFSGTVENITYEMLNVRTETGADSMTGLVESQNIPYTLYEIKVTKLYKGDVRDETITIKCPGGIFDNTEYVLNGATVISKGETYLFLTETYENSYPSLLNITQASYDMNAPETLNTDDDAMITLSQILEILE